MFDICMLFHDTINKQLKKDLEEVITVTENLILKKQEKSFDPAKIAKTNTKSSKSHNQYYHNYNTPSYQASNVSHDTHSNTTTTNIYANNPMFVQNNTFNADKQKKPIPREWGIKKDHYEIGERCLVNNRVQQISIHPQYFS